MSELSYRNGFKVIRETLNQLRSSLSNIARFDLLLYFMHAYISGFLKGYSEEEGPSVCIKRAFSNNNLKYPQHELKLFNHYKAPLEKPKLRKPFTQLFSQLSKLSDEWYATFKAKLFDDVISLFGLYLGKNGESIQQPELTSFISSLIKYDGNGILYNPFAGSATYCTELSGNGLFYGQEIKPSTWAIGVMRLLAHDKDVSNFLCQDSISNWVGYNPDKTSEVEDLQSDILFDLIVTTPPFGLSISDYLYAENKGYKKIEDYLVYKCLCSLKPTGRALLVLPQKMTYTPNHRSVELRTKFVDNDQIDTVITLPSGVFNYTNIPASIFIFSMKKENPGYVRLVDGTSFTGDKSFKNRIRYDDLLNAIDTNDPSFVKTVSIDDIRRNDYILQPSVYFKRELSLPDGFVRYNLSNITKVVDGTLSSEKNIRGKIIAKLEPFADNPFDRTLDLESINDKRITPNNYRKITNQVILLSKTPRNFNPTIVNASESNPVYIGPNIFALRLRNPALIDIKCLVLVLMTNPDSLPNPYLLRMDTILNGISVILPDTISAQKAYYLSAERTYRESKVKELGYAESIRKQKEYYVNLIRRRKHDINNLLESAQQSVDSIAIYLEEKGCYPDYLIKGLKRTVEACINNAIDRLSDISDITLHLDDEEEYAEPEVIDLIPRLEKLAKQLRPNYKINFTVDKNSLEDNTQEGNELHAYIKFGKTNLNSVINNIIGNAEKHGFTDSNRTDYVIDINLSLDAESNCYVLLFQNNGKPLPQGMDTFRYGIRGECAGKTAGKGVGGAIVKNNIEHYNGSYSITSTPDEWYTVNVELKIPYYER